MLFVCTGNICRSAFAQRLGREWLREALGEKADAFDISSAGTRAVVGSAMHPDTALALRGIGVEAGEFRARQLIAAHPAVSDLVLTMTQSHRRHVLGLAPRALARTFTLREAAALVDLLDESPAEPSDDFAGRARDLVAALADARSRRERGGDDDVPDPINQAPEVHEYAGELIVDALLPLLRRLVGERTTASAEAAVQDATAGG
ncbi:low molecular weight phosphatase family protein [Blastococcus sp. TF02-09]|nr:low molecular weight phosphatase family protein [Blastococcus sp. TF02-9]